MLLRRRWIRITPDLWLYFRGGASIQRRPGPGRRPVYLARVKGLPDVLPSTPMGTLGGAKTLAEALTVHPHRY